jgi:hypothetical protein
MSNATKKYSLTDEHRAQLKPWADRWIANALNTQAMDDSDRDAMRVAINGMYDAAKLERPGRIVFCASPIGAAFAASVAAGVWYLRRNPGQYKKLFGAILTERELVNAIGPAIAHLVRHGTHRALTLENLPAPKAKATGAATYAATGAATDAATRDATDAATDAATYDATDAATDDATDAATGDATYAATGAATGARLIRFLVGCSAYWDRSWNGGNQWSGWVAYLSFFRHVAKLDLPVYGKFAHYEAAAIHGGPRFLHDKFVIVADRPTVIARDDRSLPHSIKGPTIAWRDGWKLYTWHGTRVPERVIMAPRSYTRDEYLAIRNTEVRRALGEAAGWDWICQLLGASPADAWTDAETGLRYELLMAPSGERWLRKQSPALKLGDQPLYVEPVHEELRSAQAARKWQATRLTPAECERDPVLTYGTEA